MKNQPIPQWQGMRRFTRGLLFFLAGMLAFFLKGYVPPSAEKLLLGLGTGLFLVGFAVASQGIARQWRETAAGDERED